MSNHAFVPISPMLAHAPSLHQALLSLCEYVRLLTDQPTFRLLEDDDHVTARCIRVPDGSSRIQRFSAEMIVTGFFRLVRSFSSDARPERVSFEHAAPPSYRAEYQRVFDQAVCFERPHSEIVFARSLLNATSPRKDEEMHEALRVVAERRISRLRQRAPYALRVREFLVEEGWPVRKDMETVARALGISARSLRRHLTCEGKSYHQVESDALAIAAKHLLRDKRLTIQETAFEMGFSDTTTFHRAFKRWTGMTPRAYRTSG